MAFTIVRQPQKFTPGFNEMTYNVISTNYSQPEMKYIFKVYVDDVLVNTSKLYPLPTFNCLFDVSTIIKNYFKTVWLENPSTPVVGTTGESVKYKVDFYEEYIISNVLTESSLLSSSTSSYSFQMSCDRYETISNYMAKYIPKSISSATPFTTNQVKVLNAEKTSSLSWKKYGDVNLLDVDTYNINNNDLRTLSYIARSQDFTKYPNKMIVRGYCKNHQLLTDEESILYSKVRLMEKWLTVIPSNTAATYNLAHVPVGPSQINAMNLNYSFPFSGQPINSKAHWGYSIELVYSTSLGTGATNYYTHNPIVFKFVDDCYEYKHYVVKYKTSNYGYGYLNMNMKAQKTLTTTRNVSEIKQNYNDALYKSNKPVFGINTTGKLVLNSDWITLESDLNEFIDMLGSPEVYLIEKGSSGLYDKYTPVIPITSTYEIFRLDELVQYQIEFEEAFNKKQRI